VIRGVGKGVVLGGYVEYGKGSYSSKEDIGELGEVRGKGDSEYVGVGIIGEVEVYRGLRVEEGAKYGQVDIESSKVRGVSVIGDVGVEGQIWKIGVRCGCECYVGNRQGVRGLSKTINVCC
jgi:hypothetical protein